MEGLSRRRRQRRSGRRGPPYRPEEVGDRDAVLALLAPEVSIRARVAKSVTEVRPATFAKTSPQSASIKPLLDRFDANGANGDGGSRSEIWTTHDGHNGAA